MDRGYVHRNLKTSCCFSEILKNFLWILRLRIHKNTETLMCHSRRAEETRMSSISCVLSVLESFLGEGTWVVLDADLTWAWAEVHPRNLSSDSRLCSRQSRQCYVQQCTAEPHFSRPSRGAAKAPPERRSSNVAGREMCHEKCLLQQQQRTVVGQSATATFHDVHQFWSRGLGRSNSQRQEAAQKKPLCISWWKESWLKTWSSRGLCWAHVF